MSQITNEVKNQIKKRRTFAIISHPDAGKTTLTEKFLLYGGAINQAGSVKGKATAKHAVSDWMEIEKERGISVTSSVLQFNYDGYCINILDLAASCDVVAKSGAWYAYEGNKIGQGRENAKQYLKDNPAVCDEIAEKVREHYGLKADVAAAAEKEE